MAMIRDLWFEGFTLLPCLSAAPYDTNIKADSSSTSALCRGARSECLQAAFREEESPTALPFAHSQGKCLLAPAVFPPQLSRQMLAISRTVTNRGRPLGAASVRCQWDVVVSKGVRVQASMRACKCVPEGRRNTAAPLAPRQR